MSVDKKHCPTCNETKSINEFYKNKSNKVDGHTRLCKVCKKDEVKQYRILNSEMIKERKKQYRQNNKEKISLRDRKRREKNKQKNSKAPYEYTGVKTFACYRCKKKLIDTSFSRDASSKLGISNICKSCDTEMCKERIKKHPSGIYSIINSKNNRTYIGQAVSLIRRKADHFRHLRKGTHKNKVLQEDYDKYGADYFEFKIIEKCDPSEKRSVLYLKEIRKILELQDKGKELYNLLIFE